MIKVAVTGGSGFIGSHFIKAAQSGFDIKLLGRRSPDPRVPFTGVSLRDVDGLSRALAGCDAVVHCAHNSADEEENAVWAANLMLAANQAAVGRIIAFGTFATYDNSGAVIDSNTPDCTARIPYVAGKRKLEKTLTDALSQFPNLQLAFLQPTIVVGRDGSWDRFARRLQNTQRILLPENGEGICNLVRVETVVDAILRCLQAPTSAFGRERILKALVTDDKPITWAEWLSKHYGIPMDRMEACNSRPWAESFKRNMLLSIRYSALGDLATKMRSSKKGLAKEPAMPEEEREAAVTELAVSSHPIYIPEGLDRLTMACRAIVHNGVLP